jgi:hypothetical protein
MPIDTWVMRPSWSFLDEFSSAAFLDKMEDVGARHLAIGAAFPVEPDARHYEGAIKGCAAPPASLAYKTAIDSFLAAARDRNIHIYSYGTNPHMSLSEEVYGQMHTKRLLCADHSVAGVDYNWGACANDPEFLSFYLGRIRDVQQTFPQVEGFLNDGPEFGYEIENGFMHDLLSVFGCFGSCCENKARELGYNFADLKQAAIALMQFFHALDTNAIEQVLEHVGAPEEALAAAAGEERIAAWFRFKQDSIASYIQQLCQGVKEADPRLSMGIGARLPAFTWLTGYDFSRLAQDADFLLPKIYLWMGGFDGTYGTVYRWVKTLTSWNPHLEEALVFRFVYRLFGFALPQVGSLQDMLRYLEPRVVDTIELTYLGQPFPRAFFTEVVGDQVRQMIAQVGDAGRVRPWLDSHHGGRMLTPNELDMTLSAAQGAGLQTYLYYCSLEPGNWEVATKHAEKR